MGGKPDGITVFIEAGRRRVFASALDWPGWARSARTEELAVEALAGYLPRYALVVARAGLVPPAGDPIIAERHEGLAKNADFGSLGEVAAGDARPLGGADGARIAGLLAAAWAAFDAAAGIAPAQLRKGPRGGGRDTAQIAEHVSGAEVMYARKMGLARDKAAEAGPDAVAALRDRITAVFRSPGELVTPGTGPADRLARPGSPVGDRGQELSRRGRLIPC